MGRAKTDCGRYALWMVIALLSLFAAVESAAQVDTTWLRLHNGSDDRWDAANFLLLDNLGNVYVAGNCNGGAYDYVTLKYNSDGSLQWAREWNGAASGADVVRGLAIDSVGNTYVTGSSWALGHLPYNDDYLTLKYDPDGNLLWEQRYDGPAGKLDEARAIQVDRIGNVYVTGRSVSTAGFYDYLTLKYNTSGTLLWERRYDGPAHGYDYALGMALDTAGNVYVTGLASDPKNNWNYATVKYNPDGDTLWVRMYNGDGNSDDVARAIRVDVKGNVYVTGDSRGITNVGGSASDIVTVKYDTDGNLLWIQRYNGPDNLDDGGVDLEVGGDGSVSVLGASRDSSGARGYATVQYDRDGNIQWVRRYHRPGHAEDHPIALTLDVHANVYVCGGTGALMYDANGKSLWADPFAFAGVNDIQVDPIGNVYTAGRVNDDMFTLKLVQTIFPIVRDDSYGAIGAATLLVPAPGVLLNDTEPPGETLTAMLMSDVSHGTLKLHSDGSLLYTPSDPEFEGEDTFTYFANGGGLNSFTTATVTFRVKPGNPITPIDFDGARVLSAIDLVAEIDALFAQQTNPGSSASSPAPRCDFDCDGLCTALDLTRFVDHLFADGHGPCNPHDAPPSPLAPE